MKHLAVVLLVAACGDNKGVEVPPSPDAPVCTPAPMKPVYLNRTGGTYTKAAADDATNNVSSIINADLTLPAPTVDDGDWATVLACVSSKFTSFAVQITDVDPGTTSHVEVVMIDHAAQIGASNQTLSISPFSCGIVTNAVPFVMWGDHVNNADRCWTIAQSIGSTFGLDHVMSCPDLMTFQSGCGASDAKTFTNTDVQCGEFTARACCSGAQLQNSVLKLTTNAGLSCQ